MSNAMIGGLMFVIMIAMVILGVPVMIAMFATAIAGMWWINGFTMVLTQFTNGPFTSSASYSYAIMPLFTLLGLLASETGIAQGAYNSMRAFLAKRRGGLLYATIAGCAVFGACSGSPTAGSVIFSKIAVPEMSKYGYDKSLSLGCVTAAGALTILIPPSVPICQMAILAGYSVGTALIYGLSTGILTLIVMFLTVAVLIKIKPSLVPPVTDADRNIPWKEKIVGLKLLIPILLLFALIIGGTYLGWFHPTVGGAVGAFAVVVYALAKRIPVRKVLKACWESATLYAGVYLIIVSGTLFSRMISLSGLTKMLIDLIAGAKLPGFVVMLVVILIYLICGCVMDILAVTVVTVPIVFPLLVGGFGYDPYVLIMMGVIVSAVGSLTPPIGMGVFTTSNVIREPTSIIFKGVWPFVVAELIVILLFTFIPQTISWLPNLLALTTG